MHIPEIAISGEKIFQIMGVDITNTFLLAPILTLGVLFFSLLAFRKTKIVPGRIQNFFELILEQLFSFMDSITASREKTKEIFPIATTLFILILCSNLLELVPGVGVFHFLRSPSSDLNFTLALSLFAMFYVHISAIKKLGAFSYIKKYVNLKNPIYFFVGALEGMGELTRILSLAMRLFGNLFAGEILLIVISALFAFILPLPFLGLEILVGLIQAFIFSSLVVIFYATTTELHHA